MFRSRLPYWLQAICPRVFYITEKAWNYYPFTITGKLNKHSWDYIANITHFITSNIGRAV